MPNKINNTSSLDAVAQQLNQWRNNRAHRNIPIPIEFKRRAIALLQNHSKKQVTLALGINHKMLTQWQKSLQEISTEPPGFIELSLDHEEPLHLALATHSTTLPTLEARLKLTIK